MAAIPDAAFSPFDNTVDNFAGLVFGVVAADHSRDTEATNDLVKWKLRKIEIVQTHHPPPHIGVGRQV